MSANASSKNSFFSGILQDKPKVKTSLFAEVVIAENELPEVYFSIIADIEALVEPAYKSIVTDDG